MRKLFLSILLFSTFIFFIQAKNKDWKKGIIIDEFIYEQATFPECHAATLAETPEGIIAAWFGGTKERHPDVCIWVSRQVNGKWTEPLNVANGIVNDTLRYACWNPVLYQVPGGELQLYYKTGPNVAGWIGWMKTSSDCGKTWSDPIALPKNILGPVKNKPVMVGNKLFCPTSTETDGWKVYFDVTEDNGKTWTKIGPINDGKEWNAIQPSILTYPDGSLQVLCRTRNCAIAESWSKDNGMTWSPMQATNLPNANSGTDAVTLKDGRQLLVYNHVKPEEGQVKGARTPLNVAVSNDGKQWYASLVLEDSPISQYSYPSVIQSSDGFVHIVYTWRRERIKYIKIDPSKLVMKKIKNGLWPGTKTAVASNIDRTQYKISACDWMLLKRQKIGAISLARQIGCDGLEIDMGPLGNRPTFDNKLKDPEMLQKFKQEAGITGIKFSSVAMSGFYAQSLAEREDYVTPVQDCLDVMKGLGVDVAFLPLGVKDDLVKFPELRPVLVERLRVIGSMAEKAGVVIGIETSLDAAGEKQLLKEIGSPGIKIYFNFANPLQNGRDLHKELKILGVENICQIHCTSKDKYWLQDDTQINMPAIKKTLDDMGYKGWLVIERSRNASVKSNEVRLNYGTNARYLKKIFQPE